MDSPFSISELLATPEYQDADISRRSRMLNANQEQWRQHLREDFGPVESGDYWQSLNDAEKAHDEARAGEIIKSLGGAMRDGKITEDQATRYLTVGPDKYMEEDPEAGTFLQMIAPKEAMTGPYKKTVEQIRGANGKSVGTMWIRGNDEGAEVAYRFNDDDENITMKGDGTGMLQRMKADGTPAKDVYGVWTTPYDRQKVISERESIASAAEGRLANIKKRPIISLAPGGLTSGMAESRIEATAQQNAVRERDTVGRYSQPGFDGLASYAGDNFIEHAKRTMADKIPEAGVLSRAGGEMARGFLNTGAAVSGIGVLWGSREAGERTRQSMADIDEIQGMRQGGFEGGIVNDTQAAVLNELPALAITMGGNLGAAGIRKGLTTALEKTMVAQAAGKVAPGIIPKGLSILPKNTVANLLDGGLGKAVGTNAVEGKISKEVADRVSATLFSLPSTTRAGYEGWATTMDAADALRSEGKPEEAAKMEENATMNAWAGIGIENVSENIWLNEMLVTRTGRSFAGIGTDVLSKRLGATRMGKIKDRLAEAMGATLKAAPQGAVEEAVAGITSRAWMNEFAGQNQDLFEGLGVEMTVGALLEGTAGAVKALAENGRPEIERELKLRAVQGDPKAAELMKGVLAVAKAGTNIPVDPNIVAGSVPPEDKQDLNTVDDVITYKDDNGVDQTVVNNNQVVETGGKFKLADTQFPQEFDTREDAEKFTATRYETSFKDQMAKSMESKGSTPDEAATAIELVDRMFASAAQGAGVRKDTIYKRMSMMEGDSPAATGDTLNQNAPARDGFYSAAERTVEQKMPNRASGQQVTALLTNPQSGVKADELKWSGVIPWINSQTGPVTKEDVLGYLRDDGRVQFSEAVSGGVSESDKARLVEIEKDIDAIQNEVHFGAITAQEGRALFEPLVAERASLRKSETKYGNYQLPGGESYREVVLTMPNREQSELDRKKAEAMTEARRLGQGTGWGALGSEEGYSNLQKAERAAAPSYTSSHFTDAPNYVAHMRTNERTDASGAPGLFIEEIQSDRHQAGRKGGYASDDRLWTPDEMSDLRVEANRNQFYSVYANLPGSRFEQVSSQYSSRGDAEAEMARIEKEGWTEKGRGTPDAPFRTTWPLQMFKRALRDAVAAGKEWIGWTDGKTQNDRFNLSKQVDAVLYSPSFRTPGTFNIDVERDGRSVLAKQDQTPEQLTDLIGKEITQKIVNGEGDGAEDIKRLSGVDLAVGGEGMKGFYDKILPAEVGKYVKQWGGTVEKGNLPGTANKDFAVSGDDNTPMWKVAITPAMRDAVAGSGQPLYQEQDAGNTPSPRGSYQNIEDGARGLIKVFQNADPSTYLHEAFHALQKLNIAGKSMLDHALGTESAPFWAWATNNGAWSRNSREALEKGASGLETYLYEGVAPTPELESAFAKIAKMLRAVYQTIKDIGTKLSPEARRAFDALFKMEADGIDTASSEPAPFNTGGQIADITPQQRMNAAKLRLAKATGSTDTVLMQAAPIPPEKAPDYLEIASFYFGDRNIPDMNAWLEIAAKDDVLSQLTKDQLAWLFDRASIVGGVKESREDAAYLGDLAAEMQEVFDRVGAIDSEYIQSITDEAAKIVGADGKRYGYVRQADAMAEALRKSKTIKSANAAIERAERLVGRMAEQRFKEASKSLRDLLSGYSNGTKTGKDAIKNILRETEALFTEALSEDSGIDEDIKSAVRDVIRKTRMVAEGGKIEHDILVPQIGAAMARVAAASGRAAKRNAQKQVNAVRTARRGMIADKKNLIKQVKDAIRASKVKLTNSEVRSVLNAISRSNTVNEMVNKGNKITKILSKAYLRGAYAKARGLHAGAVARLKRGVYGDVDFKNIEDPVIKPFLALDPMEIPVELLPAYTAHLEALTDGTKAVAFGDYQESILNMTAAAQQAQINLAAEAPEIEEAAGGDPAGTASSIRADAEDALENKLRELDPGKIRPEARREAHQIKWLLSNPSTMADWSTGDIVALMKSLHNAEFGVIDVFFGKAAQRAAVAQIEPAFTTIFEIAARKELGIRSTAQFEGLTPVQERRIQMDAARLYGRHLAGLFSDAARPNLTGKAYAGKLDSAGQHFMGDFLGVGDMLDTWLHSDLYRGAIHSQKQAASMLDPFTRSYLDLENPGSVRADIERAADQAGGAMKMAGTTQAVRRQQLSGQMVMAYMLQREYENNGNTGSWLLEEKQILEGELRTKRGTLTATPAEIDQKMKIIDLIMVATKADHSAAAIYGIMTDRQKKIIKDYDKMKAETTNKVFYRSLLTRSQLLPLFKDHVHHKTQARRGDLEGTQNAWGAAIAPAPLTNAADKNKDTPVRPPSSYERLPGVRPVSWDLYDVVTEEITDVMLDFEITPILAAAGKAMRNIEYSAPHATTKEITRAVMEVEAGHAAVMAMHNNSEGRIGSTVGAHIKNWITNRAITSPFRAADELVSSAARWIAQDTSKMADGLKSYAANQASRKKWDDLFFRLGMTVAVRANQFSLEAVETRINQINGNDMERALRHPWQWAKESFGTGGGEKPTNPGMVGWLTSNKFAQKTGEWGRWLNSFGDTALAMPMAVGHFRKEFKAMTGKEFNLDDPGSNDELATRAAGISTDRFIDQNIAPSHSAKNALKVQGGIDGKVMNGALRFLLYGLGTFSRTIMHQSMAQLAILTRRSSGAKERVAAARIIIAMTIASTIYNVIAQGTVRAIRAIGGGDEEEKDLMDFFSSLGDGEYWFRQLAGGFFTNLIGGRGMFSRLMIGMGIEGAWKTARTRLWGDYDKFQHNMLNAIPAQNLISGRDVKFEDGYRMVTGLGGVAISTGVDMVKDVQYLTSGDTPGQGKAVAGLDLVANLMHMVLQYPSIKDLDKWLSAKRTSAEREVKYAERLGADYAKANGRRDSAVKEYAVTGDAEKWNRYYEDLSADDKKTADNALNREKALRNTKVLDADDWRRLHNISNAEAKAAEYIRLYNKAEDKTGFRVELRALDKAGLNVWSKDPGSNFRKELRAAGVP